MNLALRTPHVGLGLQRRKIMIGPHRQAASVDHHVTLHVGPPARASCLPGGERCVRSAGEIDVFPAGTTESWVEEDESELLELRLPDPLVCLAATEMGLDPDRARIAPRCQFRDARIEHIALALAAEDGASSSSGLLYREGLGLALAVQLLARYPAEAPPRSGLTKAQLARVTEHIEAHLDEDLSLIRLARVAAVSASHLRVLFKRSTGTPVHEYVIRRRVERARVLLATGECPASQIALEAGFSHQSHMARCMRRVLGVTPASIRRHR